MKAPDQSWPCSWEENEREHLRHNMTLTFLQKMTWLEEMTEFSRQMQSARVAYEPADVKTAQDS